MALIHDVIDSDVRFTIDPITRTISNQGSNKLMLVKGDHNSERFSFELPRLVENHDMSLCNIIRIHYINTDAKTRLTSIDIYEPNDLRVDQEDDDVVTFSWLISRSATTYSGSLAFSIEFQCVVDGEIVYAWHTGINSTISISDGIHNSEAIIEGYSDILTTWWLRLYGELTLPVEIHTMQSFEALEGKTEPNTLYLLEDDPTIEQLLQLSEPLKALDTLAKDISTIKTQLETFSVYSQAISSIENKINLLSSRVSALEKGGVVNPDNPGGSGDSGNTNPDNPTDPDNPGGSGDSGNTNPGHQHAYTFNKTVLATCTTKGYDLYICSCGAEDRRNETKILEHTWSYYQDASAGETGWSRKCTVCGTIETNVVYGCTDGGEHAWVTDGIIAATCTDPGYQKYKCSVCTEAKKEANATPLGHKYVETVVIDNTCTEPAIQKYTCERCNVEKPFEEKDVVRPALGHSWSDAIYDALGCFEPECESAGYAKYVCTVCSEVKHETIPALQHEYNDEVVNPTCTEGGYTLRKCIRDGCTHSFIVPDSQTAAKGHVWGDDPIDTGTGYLIQCTECGHTEPIEDPECDHSSEEVVEMVRASCTSGGYTVYKCTLCGHEETRDYTGALGHNHVPAVTEPTCTTGGYTTYTCSRCSDEYTGNETAATGHNWSDWTVTKKATCTDDGSQYRTCTECSEREYGTIEATGHKTTFVKGTPATCTESGVGDRNICDICKEVITGESYIAPLGHDYKTTTVAATCETGGYTTHTCSRCGDTYKSDETEPNGHHYPDGWEEKTAPTCTEAGVKIRYCEKCYKYEEGAIDPTGHSYSAQVIEPTCTTGGYTKYTCTTCGRSYTGDATDPNGHDFRIGWETVTAATCTSAGSDKRVCFTCGHIETRTIDSLGHTYVTKPIDPDNYPGDGVSSSGYVDVCTRCGDRNYESHT